MEQLGGQRPDGAFAAPIVVQDRVAMIFYGDNAPQQAKLGDISTLEIFLAQTSIALERIVLERAWVKTGRRELGMCRLDAMPNSDRRVPTEGEESPQSTVTD